MEKNDSAIAAEVNKTMRSTLSSRKVPDWILDES